MKKYKKLVLYSLVAFISLMLINIIQIYTNIKEYENNNYARKQTELNIIVNDMNKISDSIFDNSINTKSVINIFKKANTLDEDEKNNTRKELYNLLKNKYKTFTKYGIQQLHFHLPNNDSFLRFHKPSKYGDNLTKIRESVRYVNKHKKPTVGFEEGKIFNGYRFVYPMFDENKKHIGSVEVSSTLLTFKKIFEEAKNLHIDYILKKDTVEKKVFKDQMKNYTAYELSEKFLIQTTLLKYNQNDPHINKRNSIFEELRKDKKLIKKINNLEEFYYMIIYDFKLYTIDFIPLLNDFTNEKVGYIIIISKSEYFKYFLDSYLITFITILLLSILVGYIFYKKEKHREIIEKKAVEYKAILDMYENMVFIVNKCKIVNSNNKFLDFFKINNIKKLKEKRDLCKLFNNNDEHYCPISVSTDNKITNFTDKTEVSMIDYYGDTKTFSIYLHRIDSNNINNYIVELIDITEHKKEKTELEEKALKDQLTNIYNRHYFEDIVQKKFNELNPNNQYSIIMFDIDNFKVINDKYGHNTGDDSLKFLSNLFKNNIREDDIFCRWGGEEFMILTPSPLEKSVKMAEHLRKSIYDETQRDEKIPHFSCSFGVVSLNSVSSVKDGIKKVDELLYESKANGRNTVTY